MKKYYTAETLSSYLRTIEIDGESVYDMIVSCSIWYKTLEGILSAGSKLFFNKNELVEVKVLEVLTAGLLSDIYYDIVSDEITYNPLNSSTDRAKEIDEVYRKILKSIWADEMDDIFSAYYYNPYYDYRIGGEYKKWLMQDDEEDEEDEV